MIGLGPIKNESYSSTQGIQMDLAPQQLQLVATPVPLICVHIRQIPMRWSYFLMHFSSPVFHQAWFLKYYADSLLSRKIPRWQNADNWYHEEGRRTYLFHKFFFCTEISQLATLMEDKGSLSPLNTTKVLNVSPLLIVEIISNQPPIQNELNYDKWL